MKSELSIDSDWRTTVASTRWTQTGFGCGPSKVRTDAVAALAEVSRSWMGTSHRQPPVKRVVGRIREGLRTLFGLPAGWEIALCKAWGLSLKLSVIDRYDSTPQGARPNDLDYSTLLIWVF